MLTDFYRIVGRRRPDCLRILTGFWGGGFRIAYGFLPDCGEEASGLLTDFDRIVGRTLPDCLRIFTGLWREGFRIVSAILPNLVEEAYGFGTGEVWEPCELFMNWN